MPITTRTGMFRGNAVNSDTVADVQGLLTEAYTALSGLAGQVATVAGYVAHVDALQGSLTTATDTAVNTVTTAASTAQATVSAAAQSVQGAAAAANTAAANAASAAATAATQAAAQASAQAAAAIAAAIASVQANQGGVTLTGTTNGQLLTNASGALAGLTLGSNFKVANGTIDVDARDPAGLAFISDPAHVTGVIVQTTGGTRQILVSDLMKGYSGGSSAATAFTVTISSASGTVGSTTTMTVTPGTGGWPSGVVVTPAATSVAGTFSPTSASPTGTTAATFTFTSSAAGTGTLNASAPNMTSGGGQTYTATAAGSQFPSMTLVSPTFAAGKFGQALSGGSGSANIIMPSSGVLALNAWCFFANGGTNAYSPFLYLTSGTDKIGWAFDDVLDIQVPAGQSHAIYGNAHDGTWRYMQVTLANGYAYGNINGSNVCSAPITMPAAGSIIGIHADMTKLSPGDLIDDIVLDSVGAMTVPSGAAARSSSSIVLYPLGGNGTGS